MGAELTETVAARVRDCPLVADLSTGRFGTIATPVPGGRIEGVALRDGSVEIGVVARYGPPLPEVAEQVRSAVQPLVPGRVVHVSIEDITETPES